MNTKGIKMYVLISQGLIQMFVLIYLGYKIGNNWIFNNSIAAGLLAALGAIIGIAVMITNVIKAGDVFDKRKDV